MTTDASPSVSSKPSGSPSKPKPSGSPDPAKPAPSGTAKEATRPMPSGGSGSPADTAAARAVANGGANRPSTPGLSSSSSGGSPAKPLVTNNPASAAPSRPAPAATPRPNPAASSNAYTGLAPSTPRPTSSSGPTSWSDGAPSYAGTPSAAPAATVADQPAPGGIGVFDQLNGVLGDLGMNSETKTFDIYDYIGFGRIVSLSIVIGVINTLLLTALATVTAFLYNLSAGLVGGVRVTLSDD